MPIIKNIKSIETAVVKSSGGTDSVGAILGATGTATENYTIFSASCFSSSTHNATLRFRVKEGLPEVSGTYSGVGHDTVLIDSSASFTEEMVGSKVHNTTDGSTGIISTFTSSTQVELDDLTGGSDNSWDASDAYTITFYSKVRLLAGDSLSGPFVELEVDALSNTDVTVLIHMQQH
tara:strand:+ start:3049 stop:3579 length:531 start_codon:yes stop_codon:yes gene_type:complete